MLDSYAIPVGSASAELSVVRPKEMVLSVRLGCNNIPSIALGISPALSDACARCAMGAPHLMAPSVGWTLSFLSLVTRPLRTGVLVGSLKAAGRGGAGVTNDVLPG